MKKRRRVMNKRRKNGAICKAPDAVLTRVGRFRVPLKLVAHKRPPTHDTRTRVAAGFSTTDIRTMNLILRHKYIEPRAYIAGGIYYNISEVHRPNSTSCNKRKTITTEYGQNLNFPREGCT